MSKTGARAPYRGEPRIWFLHLLEIGGASRDRTDDLKLAKLALSQLSYGPARMFTNVRTRERSRCDRWWAEKELNLRPHAYQACALTT
jgi:hypothetical protein